MSLSGNRESVPAEQLKLSWRNSVPSVVLVVATAATLHYAFSSIVFEPLVRIFSVGSSSSVPAMPLYSPEVAIVAIIAFVILAIKARGRLMEWNYWAPPAIVALWSLGLFLSGAARESKREKVAQQYLAETSELRTKMQDPSFLTNLRPPLSKAREDAVMRALGDGERVPGLPSPAKKFMPSSPISAPTR